MDGPGIVAHTLSWPAVPDRYGNIWQYHPRSDRHSKVACWAVLFDCLLHSSLLRRHVTDAKVVFGVNHEMVDFKTRRKKNLDLVIARPASAEAATRPPRSLTDLATGFGIRLTAEQQRVLAGLPVAMEGPVGSVLVAVEAKACMTEHGKARPRLYDELNSSHLTIHGATDQAIAVGFVMLNLATTFLSPDRNKHDLSATYPIVNLHIHQPEATERVAEKVRELLTRTRPGTEGYDALGIVVVDCANDGRPVTVVTDPPAPPSTDPFNYDQMIRRIVHQYDTLFANI